MPAKHQARTHQSRDGFARIELAAVTLILLVLGSMAAVLAERSRLASGLGRSLANLRAQGTGYASYAMDFDDRVATFTWDEDDADQTPFSDLRDQIKRGGIDAFAAQAVHIMRTQGERPDIPVIDSWIPNVQYSQLVLADYMNEELPSRLFASPGDEDRLGWQDGTEKLPGGGDAISERWVFSSSYELPPHIWYEEESVEPGNRLRQSGSHNSYLIPAGNDFPQRQRDSLAFPSSKVMVYESAQRFFGPRDAYWAYAEARVPMLLADGSAQVRSTGDANRGWQPDQPWDGESEVFRYNPSSWEPPRLDSDFDSQEGLFVFGHYRWTRGGGAGRDFGPEIPVDN